MGLADALSRLPNKQKVEEDFDIDLRVELVDINFSEIRETAIKLATAEDPVLNQLREVIYHGWPETQKDISRELREYWSYRDELAMENGIIYKG